MNKLRFRVTKTPWSWYIIPTLVYHKYIGCIGLYWGVYQWQFSWTNFDSESIWGNESDNV